MNQTVYDLMIESGYASPVHAHRAQKLVNLVVSHCAELVHDFQDMRIPASQYKQLLKEYYDANEETRIE